MRRASIEINPGVSDISENLKGPNSDDKRRREERRWKRQLNRNESFQRKCCASATRITVKSRGNKSVVTDNNGHMVEDEVEEEHKMFLDTYVSHIDVDRDKHVDGSDIDTISVHNNDSDNDTDPQYKMFLQNLRQEGKIYVSSVIVGNQLVHIRYEEEEEDEEEEEETGSPVESLQSQETERGPCNKRPRSEVSSVPENNCDSELELPVLDEDYQIFLNSIRMDGDSLVYVENELKGKSSSVRGGEEETGCPVGSLQSQETERGPCNKRPCSEVSSVPKNNCDSELELPVLDEEYQTFLNSCRMDGGSLVYAGNELKGKSLSVREGEEEEEEETGCPVESLQSQETERGPCNERPRSEVSCVPENNCDCELELPVVDEDYQVFLNSIRMDGDSLVYVENELTGKSSSVRQNSQISDQAINTPVVQCDIDQGYPLFQNSARIIDGNPVYMRDRNITKKYNVEGGSNSSDPDLILLEPHQICENTPFISSKTYDSSWFENETNPRDSRQFPAHDHSEFRRRLMEYLEKPYNQKECDEYMQEVHRQRHKDRHFETRQRVVKSYPAYGVNKSYLELYPDVAKAIAEFKDEPHRVLFLLRGFIFWLKNLTYDGIFQPWLDKSCLEILRKM